MRPPAEVNQRATPIPEQVECICTTKENRDSFVQDVVCLQIYIHIFQDSKLSFRLSLTKKFNTKKKTTSESSDTEIYIK